ncbi:hypothetical protein ACFXHD_13835 [Streptomyces hydrogenans]|uniref:hypothetical protein n=1 Tax=Streptomyces hydrogenans TaxID=1873719 RepID=UPI003679775F
MTRNRRLKQDTRSAAARSGDRYTRVRRQNLPVAMPKLSSYKGVLQLCGSCAQPAYLSAKGPAHFSDQADGVYCPAYPAASTLLEMDWDCIARDQIADRAPALGCADAVCLQHGRSSDRFRDYNGPVYVCIECAQPAFDGPYGHRHFTDQWDGVFCSWFPLAGPVVQPDLDPRSVEEWKARYFCSYPHSTDNALFGHR